MPTVSEVLSAGMGIAVRKAGAGSQWFPLSNSCGSSYRTFTVTSEDVSPLRLRVNSAVAPSATVCETGDMLMKVLPLGGSLISTVAV